MTSIRFRIGFSVLAMTVALLLLQGTYIMERIDSIARSEVDDRLEEELLELQPVLGTAQLQAYIQALAETRNRWDEMFIEVRDPQGLLVAASPNLPEGGLLHTRPETLHDRSWGVRHPATRKGHRTVRLQERKLGNYRVLIGMTFKRYEKRYWVLREQLFLASALIALLGTLGAWWVASRALAPIKQISRRARQLEGVLEGELPRTGSGDELDRLAEVLNDLLRRIRGEVGRMHRLAADVGHALRTPLTAIRGNLELALDRAGDDDERTVSLLEQVDRMIRLVNELLTLEKIEANERPEKFAQVDMQELLADLVAHLEVLGHERQIALACKTEFARVNGDAGQLRLAIANLIDNALRHTPDGGHVDVELRRVEDDVELSVVDSGPGLRPEQLERAFERFYSLREAGSASGLGLPIARAIARGHGGELEGYAGPGGRFVLRLPSAREASR